MVRTDESVVARWREILGQYATVSGALERELHDSHGLGMSEFEVLDRLANADDKERIQEVGAGLHLSQSALSRVIGRLEKDGLVQRSLCELDRRGVFACLTDEGRNRHAAAAETYQKVLAKHLP